MVASTDIKFYVHTNNNAPQLTNNYGCMIDVLDACLINGFGAQNVSTLSASGTTVTATFGTAHSFLQYQVIKISGGNQSEYNGEHRILSVPNSTSITFQLANTPSATTATGTISCSLPSLGWLKPFGGTGKAAYRSANTLLASRPYLRVVDALDPAYTSTYAKYAKVGIVEDMSDIDTMFGVQAPFDIADPNKNWVATGSGTTVINGWARWYYAANQTAVHANINADTASVLTGNRSWIIVGNKDYFYILPAFTPSDTLPVCYGFGEFKSLINSDTSNSFLSATILNVVANQGVRRGQVTGLTGATQSQQLLLQRGYDQSASYVLGNGRSLRLSVDSASPTLSGSSDYIGNFSLTGIAPFSPVFVVEPVLRGEMNGIFWLYQIKPYLNFQTIEKNMSLYIAVNCAASNAEGQIILKIGDL